MTQEKQPRFDHAIHDFVIDSKIEELRLAITALQARIAELQAQKTQAALDAKLAPKED